MLTDMDLVRGEFHTNRNERTHRLPYISPDNARGMSRCEVDELVFTVVILNTLPLRKMRVRWKAL